MRQILWNNDVEFTWFCLWFNVSGIIHKPETRFSLHPGKFTSPSPHTQVWHRSLRVTDGTTVNTCPSHLRVMGVTPPILTLWIVSQSYLEEEGVRQVVESRVVQCTINIFTGKSRCVTWPGYHPGTPRRFQSFHGVLTSHNINNDWVPPTPEDLALLV